MTKECSNCAFFQALEQAGYSGGFCRRYPPVSHMLITPPPSGQRLIGQQQHANIQFLPQYPGVQPDFWCGEYISTNLIIERPK